MWSGVYDIVFGVNAWRAGSKSASAGKACTGYLRSACRVVRIYIQAPKRGVEAAEARSNVAESKVTDSKVTESKDQSSLEQELAAVRQQLQAEKEQVAQRQKVRSICADHVCSTMQLYR